MARTRALLSLSSVWWLCVAGCAPRPAEPDLSYLGQAQIASGAVFDDTVIGGLSAISYDPGRDLYYVISDDRSAKNPARFYTVRLALSDDGVDEATVTGVRWLRDESGHPSPPLSPETTPPTVPPDPEGIAFDPARQRLYWSSEGERRLDLPAGPVLADPSVNIADLDGRYLGRFTMPPGMAMSTSETGPRRNKTLEGLTLTPGGDHLVAAMEGPGYDDGPLPTRERGALTRLTTFDVETAAPIAQHAYPLEPVPATAASNGLSDLVALSETAFLVVERAGAAPPTVRVFLAELGDATDVSGLASLPGAAVAPMTKTLVADLSTPPGPVPLDNIEGITLGPALPDGRASVVLVSDDNFSPTQVTQFLLLAR